MSHVYDNVKRALFAGEIDLDSDDIRVAIVMTNTTADTELTADVMDDFTTLDEHDGANYVRKTCGSEAIAEDNTEHRAEFSFAAITWTALGAGTRQLAGFLVYKHVTDDTDSIPLMYIDSGGFPFNSNGGDVTFTPHADGVLQIA